MRKLGLIAIVLLLVVGGGFLMFYLYGTRVYDGAVSRQEKVNESWGNVQTAYQRRADLIGNLVETVKGAAQIEKDILVQVTQARAGIANAKSPKELEQYDGVLQRSLGIIIERYPELKSIQNFQMLQVQLEGTENQVKTERDRYNESVKGFNEHVRGFWKSKALKLVASGDEDFSLREYFEAKQGAEDAPVVQFKTDDDKVPASGVDTTGGH